MPRPPHRAAFFDVDETLITTKSMFSFLAFHLRAVKEPAEAYREARARLQRLADRGVPREEINRLYYALYMGTSVEQLTAEGREWFRALLAGGALFHPPAVQALRRHARQGDLTVLVSGSFFACLDPIAEFLGADVVLGTSPVVVDGRLTGEVAEPMIGAAKAAAVRQVAAARGLNLDDCHGYGDHISDLGLLQAVGHPVMVGDCPGLAEFAVAGGWLRLPGVSSSAVPAGV